jgi:purine-binding chemotaxis protein CheW
MSEHEYSTLLTFELGNEYFALDAMKVNHILEVPKITRVPDTPEYLKGVINLHGNIIPIADLRMMMGFGVSEYTADSAIVVIGPDEHQDSSLGLIVDMVKEVVETEGLEMKPTVDNRENSMLNNFHGTFSFDDQFVHIIDIDELVSETEV